MNTSNLLATIHNRKSVRHFIKNKSVSKEDLLTIIKAAMAAPSAVNMQPWHFIIIDEREMLDSLAEKLPYAKMLVDAPAAIVVCGDTSIESKGFSFWIEDCSLASGNILLAAEAMGLGAVWTAVYPDPLRIKPVRDLLKIPAHIMPLNVIPIGYPTGDEKPKNKFNEAKIHHSQF